MSSPYTPLILEHYRRPRNQGPLDAPDAVEEALNPLCGDRIRMEVRLKGGRVDAAAFRGDGCAISIAAASLLTGAVRGRAVGDALALGAGDVLALLGAPVPASRLRCATLPLEALQGAVRSAAGEAGS